MNVNNISSKNLDQITGEITEDLSVKENKEEYLKILLIAAIIDLRNVVLRCSR